MLYRETLETTGALSSAPHPESDSHLAHWTPEVLTDYLRGAVALARELDLEVSEISHGGTVCRIPHGPTAINQNGTFQAATFYILADYAIGLAAFGALPGYSLLGARADLPGIPLQGWLKDGYVKHIRPAKGEIRAVAKIAPEDLARIGRELAETGKVTCAGTAEFFDGETLVAIARHTFVFLKIDPATLQ